MRRNTLLFLQFGVVAVLGVWDMYFGSQLHYYETVFWWDIPAHMMGGLFVGLFAAWIYQTKRRRVSIIQCIMCAFVIGMAWEVFEFYNHTGGSAFMSYRLDTAKDLLDDMIGGAVAGYLATYKRS